MRLSLDSDAEFLRKPAPKGDLLRQELVQSRHVEIQFQQSEFGKLLIDVWRIDYFPDFAVEAIHQRSRHIGGPGELEPRGTTDLRISEFRECRHNGENGITRR